MLTLALLTFSSYVAALPLIQEEWDLSNTQAGMIFSAYLAGYAVSALFVIPLTDRISPATVLTTSAVVTVGANIAFPLDVFRKNIQHGSDQDRANDPAHKSQKRLQGHR